MCVCVWFHHVKGKLETLVGMHLMVYMWWTFPPRERQVGNFCGNPFNEEELAP